MTTLTEQGLKDGLRDLGEIRRILTCRRREAETRLVSAETEVAHLRKLDSYAGAQETEFAQRLTAMTGAPADCKPTP